MSAERVPFLDLNSQHREMEQEFVSAFREILHSGKFISGPSVEEFERAFASFCGTRFAVGVGSGTDALRFALMAAGVKAGGLVITVPNTFIATTEAITQAGATPVFVDVDPQTSNISVPLLREYLEKNCFRDDITGETIHTSSGKPLRAIIPVHLYGQTADMDSVNQIANEFGLTVIEDACQAHGAQYYSNSRGGKWIKAGALAKAAAFSFYPGKNLGAFGEGGAVTTDDPEIASTVRMLRDHGQAKKYFHEMEGYNGRLDSIQASVLSVKLKRLEEWNQKRQAVASRYNRMLSEISSLIVPFEPSWARSVYHLYVIRTPQRDMLQGFLSEKGIDTGLHYPVPLHQQKAYRSLGYRSGSFPVSEQLSKEILSLPMFPSLSSVQQERVIETIAEFYSRYIH